jgi:Flp pilus assembly protein protease CpaA
MVEICFGLVIPFVLLVILFLVGVMGAGDIKLFSMTGCFVGKNIGWIMLYSFVAGGILSLAYILVRLFARGSLKRKEKIHFSLAILIGTAGFLVKRWGG